MEPFRVALIYLDGQALPDWVAPRLAQAGVELAVRECTTRQELAEHAGEADLVWMFGGSKVVTEESMKDLRRCRAILRTGSGTDNVPVEAATRLGILVANTPDAMTDEVSDHAVALLFAVVRKVAVQDRLVRSGKWDRALAWPRLHVAGKTLGLVGFGRVARALAKKLGGFDMAVIAHDPHVSPEAIAAQGARAVELDELLAEADFVSLHSPLLKETFHLLGERELRRMKPTAVLINTSRGPVVDESALAHALSEGWIAGAGLDVLETEPPGAQNPLLELDNTVITPHIAALSADFVEKSWRLSVETVLDLAAGRRPASCVNRPVKPRLESR